jgi:hypothetical protein
MPHEPANEITAYPTRRPVSDLNADRRHERAHCNGGAKSTVSDQDPKRAVLGPVRARARISGPTRTTDMTAPVAPLRGRRHQAEIVFTRRPRGAASIKRSYNR